MKKRLYVLILLPLLTFTLTGSASIAGDYINFDIKYRINAGEQILQNPCGLAVDETRGFIYAADTGNNMVRKFNLAGDLLGSFGSTGTETGKFYQPQGIGVDKQTGDIYVADTGNHRIQKFDLNYNFIMSFGTYGSENTQFKYPADIEVDSARNVYVCDSRNNRVTQFTSAGQYIKTFGLASNLLYPQGIELDADNNLFIADTEHHQIIKLDNSGTKVLSFGNYGINSGELNGPADAAVDKTGNIFVADTKNSRIQKFDALGIFLTDYQSKINVRQPKKIEIDSQNNCYIVDSDADSLIIYQPGNFIDYVKAEPALFSPDGDKFKDTAEISYIIAEPAQITVTIYNENNELVRILIDKALRTAPKNREIWDGRNDGGDFVPAGSYTCKINAVTAGNYNAPQKSCTVDVYYPSSQITGMIIDGINPVYHALVTDGFRSTYTDLDGIYILKNMPMGNYTITAGKTGYSTESQPFTVDNDGEQYYLDFIISKTGPQGGIIAGNVMDEQSVPIADAEVTDGKQITYTDINGSYVIEINPAGTYHLSAAKRGYHSVLLSGEIMDGEIQSDKNIVMSSSTAPDIRSNPAVLDFNYHAPLPDMMFSSGNSLTTADSNSLLTSSSVNSNRKNKKGDIIPGEYIIKLKKRNDKFRDEVTTQFNAVIRKSNDKMNMYLIKHREADASSLLTARNDKAQTALLKKKLTDFENKLKNYMAVKKDQIEFIEPNRKVYALNAGTTAPNDSYLSEQWGLNSIQAGEAWGVESGSKSIIVAVVDSGVDYTHPDLAGNYQPGGYDFVDEDNDPYPQSDGIDNNGNGYIDEGIEHGTHVAGIIGAVSNNSTGIAGIAQVKILAERVLDSDGSGTSFDVADGIYHAVDSGAKIINLSLGGGGTAEEEKACLYAWNKGCLVIAAAGNEYSDPVCYPAAYPTVMAVSATDKNGNIADFSNFGPEIEVAAPGVDILSTVPNNKYKRMSGTSMAAPHVAGAAALIWSVNLALTNNQVRSILCESAADTGEPGFDNYYGYGIINVYKACMLVSSTFINETFTIYNDGGADLQVTGLNGSYNWLYVENTPFTLAPGKSRKLTAFINTALMNTGGYTDTIKVTSNDPVKNPYLIPVNAVINKNRPPAINPIDDQLILEKELLELTVVGSDPDHDNLTYSSPNLPEGASLDSSTGLFHWQPVKGQAGKYTDIIINVADGEDTAEALFTIDVVMKGDVNNDGVIDTVDAMLVGQYYLEILTDKDIIVKAADVNNDGKVNIIDSLLIAQYSIGIIPEL